MYKGTVLDGDVINGKPAAESVSGPVKPTLDLSKYEEVNKEIENEFDWVTLSTFNFKVYNKLNIKRGERERGRGFVLHIRI